MYGDEDEEANVVVVAGGGKDEANAVVHNSLADLRIDRGCRRPEMASTSPVWAERRWRFSHGRYRGFCHCCYCGW